MIKLTKNDFEKLYNILYEAFPPTEIRTKKEQLKLFDRKEYEVYADNTDIKVFMATWNFKDFCFLEHFAVDKKYRGQNLGSDFFKQFVDINKKILMFEVEPPTTDISKKRINFYKRLGAKLNNFKYMQPSMQISQPSIELKIMSYPDKLDKKTFDNFKKQIYKTVYNIH